MWTRAPGGRRRYSGIYAGIIFYAYIHISGDRPFASRVTLLRFIAAVASFSNLLRGSVQVSGQVQSRSRSRFSPQFQAQVLVQVQVQGSPGLRV